MSWAEHHNIAPEDPLPERDGQPMLFIANVTDAQRIAKILQQWPDATITTVHSARPEHDFISIFVPA